MIFFSEKRVNKTPFDKKWFSPTLKLLHRRKQREFLKNRGSLKFKSLQKKFNRLKKINIKYHYVNITERLKKTNPRNFFKVMKTLTGDFSSDQCDVEELVNLSPLESAEKIATHFAAISCSYEKLQLDSLPAYLPAPEPPQVTESQVLSKLSQMKHTRSTFPIDMPHKIMQICKSYLAHPLSEIFNTCLKQHVYPEAWKLEYVTPIQKCPQPKKCLNFARSA